MAIFAALEVDRSRQCLVAIEGTAGDSRNFPVVDNGLAILDYGDLPSDQRDIKTLPDSGPARQFRRRSQETVHPASVVARRFREGIVFDLNLVTPAQIHPAIGVRPTVELDVQLEIFE